MLDGREMDIEKTTSCAYRDYLKGVSNHLIDSLFLLSGHNSQIWMIECQVQYTIDAITKTIDQDLSSVEVRFPPFIYFYTRLTLFR